MGPPPFLKKCTVIAEVNTHNGMTKSPFRSRVCGGERAASGAGG